jgi:hypothetical protein
VFSEVRRGGKVKRRGDRGQGRKEGSQGLLKGGGGGKESEVVNREDKSSWVQEEMRRLGED